MRTILDHGDRVSHVGLFFFRVDATGTISRVGIAGKARTSLAAGVSQAVAAWPHSTWLMTVRNDGYEFIFRALVEDAAAQDTFIVELHRILDAHPWAARVDPQSIPQPPLRRSCRDRQRLSRLCFAGKEGRRVSETGFKGAITLVGSFGTYLLGGGDTGPALTPPHWLVRLNFSMAKQTPA